MCQLLDLYLQLRPLFQISTFCLLIDTNLSISKLNSWSYAKIHSTNSHPISAGGNVIFSSTYALIPLSFSYPTSDPSNLIAFCHFSPQPPTSSLLLLKLKSCHLSPVLPEISHFSQIGSQIVFKGTYDLVLSHLCTHVLWSYLLTLPETHWLLCSSFNMSSALLL